MLAAVGVKFRTHPAPRDLLPSTGDARIVENAPLGACWGCGADGQGFNRLGEILMRVRHEPRAG